MKRNKNVSEEDLKHLKHRLVLAEEAFKAGDEPFGSILVNQKNGVIPTARNRMNTIYMIGFFIGAALGKSLPVIAW